MARELNLVTSTPDFEAAVYAAANAVPSGIGGWQKVSDSETVQEDQRFRLRTRPRRFQYYLVWITQLPEAGEAKIQELSLKR
jgi:hypothetical protein